MEDAPKVKEEGDKGEEKRKRDDEEEEEEEEAGVKIFCSGVFEVRCC